MTFNSDLIFGILFGILAYIVLYLGKGLQKSGIEGLKKDKTIKSKHSGTWILGTILTSSFMFIQWIPLTIFNTPANLIVALEGIGLITLLIYSFKVLKEPLSRIQIYGAIFIIVGIIIMNIWSQPTYELELADFNQKIFWIVFVSVLIPEFMLILISKIKKSKILGIFLALNAGSFMAFQTISKRLTDINEITLFFTALTLITAIFTLLMTQIAFSKANANIVVPIFTSTSIILTTILGILSISEVVDNLKILGIVGILIGVVMVTRNF